MRETRRLRQLEAAVRARLEAMARDRVPARVWERDHTVWSDQPTEVADRLGWLSLAQDMEPRLPELRDFARRCAAEGLTDAVLLGMGGSSLAPETFRLTFGVAPGMLDLHVLDTTHPGQIAALERSLDLGRTLFVVASKSGTTVETLSHLAYFWERTGGDGSRFVAITDPGTPLAATGRDRVFRGVFENPPDIGGRYSALSLFGLVPAALIGADLDRLLAGAREMASQCGPDVPASENPGAWLGAVMGEAALAGQDKLTFVLPRPVASLGAWLEQLVAESTGKLGRGIVPVEGEDLGEPEVYGYDRLFAEVGEAGFLGQIEEHGHPVAVLPFGRPEDLGAQMFEWEFATAIAGHVLGIHPFDQPDVEAAKQAARAALEGGGEPPDPGSLSAVLSTAERGHYLAIQAYLPRDASVASRLHRVRMRLRDRLKLATTVGFGPRFLHSTGQLHKGGPNSGLFVQVVDPVDEDLPIPGQPHSFGQLLIAQADGDLAALRGKGRRAVRVSLAELEEAAR